MLIECMILREGMTIVDIKAHKFQFMPIPGSKKGEMTTSVCDVADDEDVKYLIGDKEKGTKGHPQFRAYDEEIAYRDLIARRADRAKKEGRFKGYAFEKITLMGQDRGYMVVYYPAGGGFPLFYGQDGRESSSVNTISPFKGQSEAADWLERFVDGSKHETRAETPTDAKPAGAYICLEAGCGKTFDNPMKLAGHWSKVHAKETKEKAVAGAGAAAGPAASTDKKPPEPPAGDGKYKHTPAG
jgi:hypothetical protein